MRLFVLAVIILVVSCAEFQEVMDSFNNDTPVDVGESQPDIPDEHTETEEEDEPVCVCN